MIRRLLLLGAFALTAGVALRISLAPAPAIAVSAADGGQNADVQITADAMRPSEDGQPRWSVLWTRPVPGFAAMAISPHGQNIAWVDGDGAVRRLDAQGRTLWQTDTLPGVNRLVAAPSGTVLAYSWLNPAKPILRVLTGKYGKTRQEQRTVEGAIWNVGLAPDGSQAVVGTGERAIYTLPLAEGTASPPLVRWRSKLAGIPDSLAVTAAEPLAVFGTWQESGVSAWSLDGSFRWRAPETEPDRKYRVCFSGDGATTIGVSARGPRQSNARLHVWETETGRALWTEDLDAFRPHVLTTRDGNFIAVSYVKMYAYRTGMASEGKLAVFNRSGRKIWKEKYGLYFSPQLVALSPDGKRLTISDGVGTLYTLDERGSIVSQLRLPADSKTGTHPTIRQTLATDDGAYLLILRGDGQISLLKAT